MRLSRLRIRLGAWFALVFVVALAVLHLLLYAYLQRENSQRLVQSLRDGAVELIQFVQHEHREHFTEPLARGVHEALIEWPARPAAFVVYDAEGIRIGERGDAEMLRGMPATLTDADTSVVDVASEGKYPFRHVTVAASGTPRFFVRTAGSTQLIVEESRALQLWLIIAVPIVLILSFMGGYVLSRRALTPIEQLERAVADIAPETLDQRLPVVAVRDEIDQLAVQFNQLLDRLQRAQQRNRQFLQQAAHQIRTPLTLVLGEADLSLDRPRTPTEQQEALKRIRTAAKQMQRRVDELFLLAQAEAGERLALDSTVELDGLIFECADLMRGRAQQLGQRLELPRADAAAVCGNEPLLKEAVLELIENACRYGSREHPISISTSSDGELAYITVRSWGAPPPPHRPGNENERGLGLTIVRWIASEHGGALLTEHEAGVNEYRLRLPALAANDNAI